MKKPKNKLILIIALSIAAGLLIWFLLTRLLGGGGSTGPVVSASALAKTDLTNLVSATGTLESADSAKVYSEQSYEVAELLVQVGDVVQEGDVLCRLDTQSLELDIAAQEATLSSTQALNQHALAVSERKLQQAEENLGSGHDSGVNSARSALRSADDALDMARHAYEEAQAAYNQAPPTIGASDKQALRIAMDQAEESYENAKSSYRLASTAYETALIAADQGLLDYEDSVVSSQLSADLTAQEITLQKLKLQLDDATVKAPISGMVTAVYAEEGSPGSGLLFIIEDTDSLIVKTKLKEYDINTVQEGMSAVIKSDATGETEYAGEVERIHPAAVKAADGSVQSGNVEFETDVRLTSNEPGLRIGMNVRLNIVTAERKGVWAVPFEAVVSDAQGQEIVYVARDDGSGRKSAHAVPVTTGLETDFYIEISSEGLSDGDLIISDPATYGVTDGMPVLLSGLAGGVQEG